MKEKEKTKTRLMERKGGSLSQSIPSRPVTVPGERKKTGVEKEPLLNYRDRVDEKAIRAAAN